MKRYRCQKLAGIIIGAILLFPLLMILPEVSGDGDPLADIFVDDDGGFGIDYTSIQEAVSAADPGDTIFVYSGLYDENIVIDKELILLGEDPETTIIDGGGRYDDIVTITTDDWVVITGFTVQHSSRENMNSPPHYDWFYYDALHISSDNNAILGNIFKENTKAIEIHTGHDNLIENNTFLDNTNWNIHLKSSSRDNVINDNIMIGLSNLDPTFSIELDDAHQNIITNNVIDGAAHGIWFTDASTYNTIHQNYLLNCSNNVWMKNSFDSPTFSTHNIITENIFEGGNFDMEDGKDNDIYHNAFYNIGIFQIDYNNNWDDGYPSGGNYWDNYRERYPLAQEIGDSGIWDTPYDISGSTNQDQYPLMEPYGTTQFTLILSTDSQTLTEGDSFEVMVTANGVPIEEADVRLVGYPGQIDETNENGIATFTAPDVDQVETIVITATKNGYQDGSTSITVFDSGGETGSIIYVDDNNTHAPWDGTEQHPYQYIQDGVDAADPGDTVYVFEGTYVENIDIEKSITLQGQNQETTIIDGNLEEDHVVFVHANEVTISGFTIQYVGAIWIPGDFGHWDCRYGGVTLAHSHNNVIQNNTIRENYKGIIIESSSNNVISNNNMVNNTHMGIQIRGSSSNTISENCLSTTETVREVGIEVEDSSMNVLQLNTVQQYIWGVLLWDGSNWNDIIRKHKKHDRE